MKKQYAALTNTLGPNATQVLGRIKVQLDPQPQLRMEGTNYPSEQWVQWFMRIHNAPREVALNQGYELLDYEGDSMYASINLNWNFEPDLGLKVIGITRTKDYFALGGHLVRQHTQSNRHKKT